MLFGGRKRAKYETDDNKTKPNNGAYRDILHVFTFDVIRAYTFSLSLLRRVF